MEWRNGMEWRSGMEWNDEMSLNEFCGRVIWFLGVFRQIISVAIAVVCLFRFWTGEEKKTQQELNSELHMRSVLQWTIFDF